MRNSYTRVLLACAMTLSVSACGGEDDIIEAPLPIHRPDQVNAVERQLTTRVLPDGASDLLTVVSSDQGVLLGGPGGLYGLTPTELTRLDPNPVIALANYTGLTLVARSEGLYIWDAGELTASPLTTALDGGVLTELTVRGDVLWISTTRGLFAYSEGEVASLMETTHIQSTHGGQTASYLVTTDGDTGALNALEPGEDAWQVLNLSETGPSVVRPGDQSLYGLMGGELFQYLTSSESAVWRRQALNINGEPEGGITHLATSDQGQLWGMTPADIFKVKDSTVSRFDRADGLDANTLIIDGDDTVWISDGETLATYFDVPPDTVDASWSGSVSAFAEANCSRCHGVLGTAHGLHTHEQWASEINEIIAALTDETMPADGQALTRGDLALLRAWKDGGLR